MKILFVFGGLPHYFNKVLNRINSHQEIEVVVVAPANKSVTIGSGVHETEDDVNFKIIRLPEVNKWYGKPFFKGFLRAIRKENPEIIVIGWPYFLIFIFNPFLLIYIKRKGIKLFSKEIPFTIPAYNETITEFSNRCAESQKVEKIFSSPIVFRLHKLMRKFLYTRVFNHALLYVEHGVQIISSYGIPRDSITVTYNSPDTDAIFKNIADIKQKYPEIKHIPFRILHVGRLVKWKNVHLLIDAVNQLKDRYPLINLAIIGKGEEELNLKKQVEDLGLIDHVEFLGAIYEGEDQSIEMLKAQIYILAGMGGLSINEAMAHGLPVICSIADGTEKHLVFEGVNGYFFKDNDLDSLISAIEKSFNSDLELFGTKSYNIIKGKINIGVVADRYVEAFLTQKSNQNF